MAILHRSNWLARHLMVSSVFSTERAVARNKLVTNAALRDLLGAATPRLISVFDDRPDIFPLWLSKLPPEVVIKSAVSSVGRHVCVLRRDGDGWVEPDGLRWTAPALAARLRRMPRPVFAEEIVRADPALAALAAHGTLCDLRLHFVGAELIVGRCRIPTRRSRGYGNVGRGALGVCFHPDGRLDVDHPYARLHAPPVIDDQRIHGLFLPGWPAIFEEARRVAGVFASPHVGIDGTLAPDGRFVVIEVTLVPDTKWLSARGTLAFRDAFRRAREKAGRVEGWLRTRPDLWRWIERRVATEGWEPAERPDATGDEAGLP